MSELIVPPSLRLPTKENANSQNNVLVITERGRLTIWQYCNVSEDFIKYWIDVVPELIPVTSRLPKHCEQVLSINKHKDIQLDFYDEGLQCWYSEITKHPIRVTDWVALPEEVIDFIAKEVSQ